MSHHVYFCEKSLNKGGSRPFKFENTILTYGLGLMAWTCTNNFRVLLGSCALADHVHVRPRSKKMGQKLKTKKNQEELSYCHHSIRLVELIILVWSDVKIG